MSRQALRDEVPVFGQVWRYGNSAAMMAICMWTPTFAGMEWLFLRLSDREFVPMFWMGYGREVLPEWELLDD